MKIPLIVSLVVLAAGCSSITPVAVHSNDVCWRCRRQIVETRLAAEVVDFGGHAFKFRTAGCLAQYLADHDEKLRALFVTDYTTGKLIDATNASFVPAEIDKQTGERDYLAFALTKDAAVAAETHRTAPIAWQEVCQRARRLAD